MWNSRWMRAVPFFDSGILDSVVVAGVASAIGARSNSVAGITSATGARSAFVAALNLRLLSQIIRIYLYKRLLN